MNLNHLNKIICFITVFFITANIVYSKENQTNSSPLFKDKFAIGISIEETAIPLLRAKLRITSNIYTEARFGVANETKGEDFMGVFLYGARFYHILKSQNTNQKFDYNKLYWGIEADYLDVRYLTVTLGTGYVGGFFVGVEKFLTKRFSFNTDIGPYYVYIKHPIFDKSVNSVDIIFNLMFNYHFW